MSDFRKFYARVTNPYGAAGPFYGKAGHHGCDFAVAAHGVIPSYFDGECVLNGHSSVLGNYSVYKRADGKFAGFAHLLVGTRQNVGDHVKPGDSIGKAAGSGDDHGSAWRGAHCHTTLSFYLTGIYDGRTADPWPSIKSAIGKAATVAPKPASALKGRKWTTAKSGEGLSAIATRMGVSLDQVKKLNPSIKGPKYVVRLGQRVYYS